MCDPLTIAGVVATAGSAVANNVANNRAQAARDDALNAERYRQGQLDREAATTNQGARERYSDFEGQQDEKASGLADMLTQSGSAAPADPGAANASAGAVMPSSSNDVVTREMSKQSDIARAFTDQQGQSLANLRSFGDVLGSLGRDTARDAGTISQIASFKQGSSAVLPYELEAANQEGAGLRTIGDILGGVGSLATTAGLSGGSLPSFLGGGAAATTPAVTSSIRPLARPASLGSYL